MASRKYGTFCVPGRPKPGLGTQAPKYGTSREIRDGWQQSVALYIKDAIATRDFCISVRAVAQNSPPLPSN